MSKRAPTALVRGDGGQRVLFHLNAGGEYINAWPERRTPHNKGKRRKGASQQASKQAKASGIIYRKWLVRLRLPSNLIKINVRGSYYTRIKCKFRPFSRNLHARWQRGRGGPPRKASTFPLLPPFFLLPRVQEWASPFTRLFDKGGGYRRTYTLGKPFFPFLSPFSPAATTPKKTHSIFIQPYYLHNFSGWARLKFHRNELPLSLHSIIPKKPFLPLSFFFTPFLRSVRPFFTWVSCRNCELPLEVGTFF